MLLTKTPAAQGPLLTLLVIAVGIGVYALLAVCRKRRAAACPGIGIGSARHIGAQREQQDAFGLSEAGELPEKGLLAVAADGGGREHGAQSARAAVEAALRSFQTEAPEKSGEAALLRILKRAREALPPAGGTSFLAVLMREQSLYFLSVGPIRLCLLRSGGLIQLNRERVYREPEESVSGTGFSAQQTQTGRHSAFTSFLGMPEADLDRNTAPIPLSPGDRLALMTDGVYRSLTEEELTALLCREPEKAAEDVQNAILAKNDPQQDNLTIIVLEIE